MKTLVVWVIATCALIPSNAIAQSRLDVGERVRVRIEGEHGRVIGRVLAIASDSLELQVDRASASRARDPGSVLRLGVEELLEIERSVGMHRNTGLFAVTFGLFGAAAGAYALGTCQGCYSEWALGGATVFGLGGLVFGAIVGTLVVSEEWQRVVDPRSVGPRIGYAPGVGPHGAVVLTWSVRP